MKKRNIFNGHLFLLLIIFFVSTGFCYTQSKSQQKVKINNRVPKKVKVGEELKLNGTADIIPEVHYLWIQVCLLKKGKRFLVSLENIVIKENSKNWEATISFAGEGNLGEYEIAVIVVKEETNKTLIKFRDEIRTKTEPLGSYQPRETADRIILRVTKESNI
jgi:hypothetical protein